MRINTFTQDLLVRHLSFSYSKLKENEDLINLGFNKLGDEFFKLIIDVKYLVDIKKIEYPTAYFLKALENELIKKRILKKTIND
jgi:hypothetical protein